MPFKYVLGFVGAGNMAEAIARGAIKKGVLRADRMVAYDPSETRCALFESLGIKTIKSNAKVIRKSEQVMLAIKPQILPELASDLAENGSPKQILISIMAGIGTQKLAKLITDAGWGNGHSNGTNGEYVNVPPTSEQDEDPSLQSQASPPKPKVPRIIRVMPNTPMMVGLGMAGLALGEGAHQGDESLAMKLFGAAGKIVRVEEALMDAITAISGSGPAYVYYLAEAMEKAAAELGLGEHGRLLVSQTIMGAARMLADSPDVASELRRKVTSPGGTTAAAIEHMESNNLINIIVDALKAAEARGRELGQ